MTEDVHSTVTLTRTSATLPGWALPACRLWRRENPHGAHLEGVWGGVRVMVFVNTTKRDAADADATICFSPRVETRHPLPDANPKENS